MGLSKILSINVGLYVILCRILPKKTFILLVFSNETISWKDNFARSGQGGGHSRFHSGRENKKLNKSNKKNLGQRDAHN